MTTNFKNMLEKTHHNFTELKEDIKSWGKIFGLDEIGISDLNVSSYITHLDEYLENKYHGAMHYLEKIGPRKDAKLLLEKARSCISCRVNYPAPQNYSAKKKSYSDIAAFAQNIDRYKEIQKKLELLVAKIKLKNREFNYRIFCGGAPLLEKSLAEKAGLGWIGKNTLLINEKAGSFFLIGEIITDLPLPPDLPKKNRCGICKNCIEACPTKALIAPYKLNANLCISYHTIENKCVIPRELRSFFGEKIFGCDECQKACPYNRVKFHNNQSTANWALQEKKLSELMLIDEKTFRDATHKTPLKRLSHEMWLRNIAVALGNAKNDFKNRAENIAALKQLANHSSKIVREHIAWALEELTK